MRLLLVLSLLISVSAFMLSPIRRHLVRCGGMARLSSHQRSALHCTATEVTPPKATASAAPAAKLADLSLLDIRVGKVVEIGRHPEADGIFVQQVDVGDAAGPRTIASKLVEFCKEEDLLNSHVIVLCNLKPRVLKGITSSGMLLCASNAEHTQVAPLAPPPGAAVGELISFSGYPAQPLEAGNKATKAFGKIAEDFFVNDDCQATYKGVPFMTQAGPVHCALKGKIS